jgi:hypothetical protein
MSFQLLGGNSRLLRLQVVDFVLIIGIIGNYTGEKSILAVLMGSSAKAMSHNL